jgi:hypothetical protein
MIDFSWVESVWEHWSINIVCLDYFFLLKFFNYFLALLFGDELPQHSQQAGIIDPLVDVAAVINGKLIFYLFLHLHLIACNKRIIIIINNEKKDEKIVLPMHIDRGLSHVFFSFSSVYEKLCGDTPV